MCLMTGNIENMEEIRNLPQTTVDIIIIGFLTIKNMSQFKVFIMKRISIL